MNKKLSKLQLEMRWKYGRVIDLYNDMQNLGFTGTYHSILHVWTGNHIPTIKTIKYIARALNRTIDELVIERSDDE